MASLLKLKTDIKKLKAAISSKATSGAIKTKLRGKLTTLENELDKLQPNKRKPKTTGPKSESALVKLAKKRRTNQGLSTSKSDIERDAIRPAKPAGKRISASGNVYYEYRDNRVDNRQPPKKYRKLADGGKMADGGMVVLNTEEDKEDYANDLKDFILEKYIGKSVLGFKLTDEAYDGETPWTWKLKKKKIDVFAEPFNESIEEGITIAAYENEDEPIGMQESVEFELTGNFDKDADKYLELVKPYLQKYASGNYAHGGQMAKGGKTKDQEVVRGYFEDEAYEYADGGLVVKSDEDLREIAKYMAKAVKKRWDLKDLVYYFEQENNYDYKYRVKIWDEMNVWEMKKTEENIYKVLKAIVEANEQGGVMADGGSVAKGNYEMLMSQAKEVMHHAEELMQVAKPDMDIEAWVVAKAERATTDLSDITHYLDGLKMAMGGMVKHNAHKVNA